MPIKWDWSCNVIVANAFVLATVLQTETNDHQIQVLTPLMWKY